MANPLAILGGLMTAGAQGVAGGLEGQFEGEQIRRKNLSEDQANQMRALEMALTQQKLRQGMQPEDIIQGGYIFRKNPMTGALTPIGPAPKAPLGPLDLSRQREQESLARLHEAQTGQVGKPPVQAPPQLDAKTAQALEEWRRNPANAGKSLMDFHREFTAATTHVTPVAPQRPFAVPPGAPVWDPVTGKVVFRAPERSQKPERGPRTREVTRNIRIDDNNRNDFQESVNALAGDLTAQGKLPGDALSTVTKRDGTKELKTRFIERMYAFDHPGLRVQVGWDPVKKRFVIVRAWEVLEQRDAPSVQETEE